VRELERIRTAHMKGESIPEVKLDMEIVPRLKNRGQLSKGI